MDAREGEGKEEGTQEKERERKRLSPSFS